MALELNVSENFLKQIQQGNKHYNMEHLFLLSKKFNCPVDVFLPNPDMYLRIRESNKDFASEYPDYSEFESDLIEELWTKRRNIVNE